MHTQQSLAEALISRQLLAPDATPLTQLEQARPWYVSGVLGVAGWLAGCFALAFMAAWLDLKHATPIAAVGVVLLAAALGVYRIERDNPFLGQLALALSIAGQAAMVWAVSELTKSSAQVTGFATLLQLAVLWLMPNRFAKTLAALFACIAWALTMRSTWVGDFSFRNTPASFMQALACWWTAWIPLLVAAQSLITQEVRWVGRGLQRWARPALTGVLASLAVTTWLTDPFMGSGFLESRASSWMAVWPLLSMLVALFAAYCAFRLRHRALLGLAACGVLLHVGHFYYLLSTTLLIKACVMMLLGATLLITAWQLGKRGM